MTNQDPRYLRPMTAEEFEAGLDRYGADFEGWPIPDRDRALALLAEDALTRRIWEAAKQVDALLANLPLLTPSADLRRRVAETPLRTAYPKPSELVPKFRLWFPALVAAMGLGAAVGWVTRSDLGSTGPSAPIAVSDSESDPWLDLENGTLLAFVDESWDEEESEE